MIGCIAAVLLLRFQLGRMPELSWPLAVLQVALAGVVAVLIGNLVKEAAFALCEHVVIWLGQPFVRTTRTMRGRSVSETYFPGGTWIRCETWNAGATWEWTERDGSCTRLESPSMAVARATPWQIWQGRNGQQ